MQKMIGRKDSRGDKKMSEQEREAKDKRKAEILAEAHAFSSAQVVDSDGVDGGSKTEQDDPTGHRNSVDSGWSSSTWILGGG